MKLFKPNSAIVQVSEMTEIHSVYLLKSVNYCKTYIGATTDFNNRLRQHNGEICGGAKKTVRWRPWEPVCVVSGFINNSQKLRFEYRLQKSGRKPAGECPVMWDLKNMAKLLSDYDRKGQQHWPVLMIEWYKPFVFK